MTIKCVTGSVIASFIASIIAVSGCASRREADTVLITDLVARPAAYDGEVMRVRGCVSRSALGVVHLASCDASRRNAVSTEHVDVIGYNPHPGTEMAGALVLKGLFRAYSAEFQGMGHLTSTIGILEVSDSN